MWIVLKIEIKNYCSGKLEYIQDEVIGSTDSLDEAKAILNDDVTKTLAHGYFDKEIYHGETMAQFTNGGTAYLKYKIHKI